MKRLMLAMAMALGAAIPASAQFCPSCVQNSAVVQNAQFNVSSATVRGALTVGSINISSMTISTITAGAIFGGGQGITNLNASQILSGHLSSAAVNGPYPGITSVGAIASGSWQGGIVASPFGGTGANLGTANPGSIPYFASIGTMTALPPDVATYLLQTNGPLPPSWTHAPQVVGTNIVSIPMANLIPGQLPMDISINDASISTVSASKVIGDISGFSANMVGTLPIGQLGFGTLPNGIPASSITVTGVAPGTYGISGFIPRYTVGTDGRLTFSTQTAFSISPSSMTPGPLPPGVTVPPGNITAGTLPGNVIASSVAATGVSAGTYGGGLYTVQITVGGDGRATSVTSIPILVSPSSITAGVLPYNVAVPPSSILPGALPSNVVASSFNATGVTAGTYGDSTHSVTLTVDPYGRLTLANASPIPGTSTSTVVNNVDNAWQHSQTFVSGSSLTINGNELVTGTLTAGFFSGDGSLLVNLNPVNISAGTLPGNVIASSVAATGVVPGLYGDATHVAQVTVGADGRATTIASILIVGSAASTVPSTGVLSGFLNPGVSVTTTNVQPGFNSASELVQLNASGQLPALDAHLLTALTAANLVGAVPSGSVSFSTITTALATVGASTRTVTSGEAQIAVQDTGLTYKITTVGISSACPSGQGFAQVTSSNGVITGGTCATFGGGSGGSGGWNTTGSVVYLTTGTNNVVIQSTLTVQGNAFSVGGGSFAVVGGSVTVAYSVTAASFVGNGSNLISLTAANLVGAVPSGAVSFSTITTAINAAVVAASNANAWTTSLPVVFLTTATNNVLVQSTLTVQGNAFSVGGSTLAIVGGSVGIGTTAPQALLDVNGNAQFGSGATKSTFTTTGDLNLASGADLATTGSDGEIVSQSSITTLGGFFGDGSHLAGVATTTVAGVLDNLTNQCNGSSQSFLLSQAPTSSATLSVHLDGLELLLGVDYLYSPPKTITITTAPQNGCATFFAQYLIGTSVSNNIPSPLGSGGVGVLSSSQSVIGTSSPIGTISGTIGGVNTPNLAVCFSTSAHIYAGNTRAEIKFSGSVLVPAGGNAYCVVGALLDGQYISWNGGSYAETSQIGLGVSQITSTVGNRDSQINFDVYTETLSSGTHSICMTFSGTNSSSCSMPATVSGGAQVIGLDFFNVLEVP